MEQPNEINCKQLPVEIWRKILSHVDQFHLIKNVSRVNRLLYAVSNSLITDVLVSFGRLYFGMNDLDDFEMCQGISAIEFAAKIETFHKKYKYLSAVHLDELGVLARLALQLVDNLKHLDAQHVDLKDAIKDGLIKTENLRKVTLHNIPESQELLRSSKLETVSVNFNDLYCGNYDIFEYLSFFISDNKATIKSIEMPPKCLTEHMQHVLPRCLKLRRLALKRSGSVAYTRKYTQDGLLEISKLSSINCLEFDCFSYIPAMKNMLLSLGQSLETLIWDGDDADRILKIALQMSNLKSLKVIFRGGSAKNKITKKDIAVKCQQLEVLHLIHCTMTKPLAYSLSNITTLKELKLIANSSSQSKALEHLKTVLLYGSFTMLRTLTLQTCPGWCKDSHSELENPNNNFIELLMTVMNKCDKLVELRLPEPDLGFPIEEIFLTSFLDELPYLTTLEVTLLDINLSADIKERLKSFAGVKFINLPPALEDENLINKKTPLPSDEVPLPSDEAPLPSDEVPLPSDEAPNENEESSAKIEEIPNLIQDDTVPEPESAKTILRKLIVPVFFEIILLFLAKYFFGLFFKV